MIVPDSDIYGRAFFDPAVAALFDDEAELSALLDVESALAKVQGELGIIPADAAETIQRVLKDISLDPTDLATGCRRDGVVVPALVKTLRQALPEQAAPYLHWGATSQDIVDTGLVLRLAKVCVLLNQHIQALGDKLAGLAEREKDTVTVARTRSQWAMPTLAGLKAANWLAPLVRQRQRLLELKSRLLVVQLGGAAGTLASLGDKGPVVTEGLARELGLEVPLAPWHTQRDSLLEFANWSVMTSGTLGKFGQDLILLSQSDVAELRLSGGGGSSAMPHKANPVGPEALVTLARHNAGLMSNLHNAMVHANERDGAAWMLEWLNLPQIVCTTAGALNQAQETAAAIEFSRENIQDTLDATRGNILSEAMVFALSEYTDRARAQTLVKEASIASAQSGELVVDCLQARVDYPVDWEGLKQPHNFLGSAAYFIQNIVAHWRS